MAAVKGKNPKLHPPSSQKCTQRRSIVPVIQKRYIIDTEIPRISSIRIPTCVILQGS